MLLGGQMHSLNEAGTIYFGTKFENINKVLLGLSSPIERDEKYISVSVSGYKGLLPLTVHEEILYLGNIYKSEYNALDIDSSMYCHWKTGYKNSLTYIDGFGPNKRESYNVFGEQKENNRKGQNVAFVIDKKYQYKLMDSKALEKTTMEEHFSLALHSFISEITYDMISGIVFDSFNIEQGKEFLKKNKIDKKIWNIENC